MKTTFNFYRSAHLKRNATKGEDITGRTQHGSNIFFGGGYKLGSSPPKCTSNSGGEIGSACEFRLDAG